MSSVAPPNTTSMNGTLIPPAALSLGYRALKKHPKAAPGNGKFAMEQVPLNWSTYQRSHLLPADEWAQNIDVTLLSIYPDLIKAYHQAMFRYSEHRAPILQALEYEDDQERFKDRNGVYDPTAAVYGLLTMMGYPPMATIFSNASPNTVYHTTNPQTVSHGIDTTSNPVQTSLFMTGNYQAGTVTENTANFDPFLPDTRQPTASFETMIPSNHFCKADQIPYGYDLAPAAVAHTGPKALAVSARNEGMAFAVRVSQYWAAPRMWDAMEAGKRGSQVFSDPFLSANNLPPEAALLWMPVAPDFPEIPDKYAPPRPKDRGSILLRDVPFLPPVFDLTTQGWQISLLMVFGASVKDMVARVPAHIEAHQPRMKLENRLLKKSIDYRNRCGGFGQNCRLIKGGAVTAGAREVVAGSAHRAGLSVEQLLHGVFWPIDLETRTMQQPGARLRYLLPVPADMAPTLRDVFTMLNPGVVVPTLENSSL